MYARVGQAVREALGPRPQVWLADQLQIDGSYLNRVLQGKQKASEPLVREIAYVLGEPTTVADRWVGLLRECEATRRQRRQEVRQRIRPAVDYADSAPPEPIAEAAGEELTGEDLTGEDVARVIGVLPRAGLPAAKIQAIQHLLTSGSDPRAAAEAA